jgi:hypothetical protein
VMRQGVECGAEHGVERGGVEGEELCLGSGIPSF